MTLYPFIYSDRYLITKEGCLLSLKTNKTLKQYPDKDGYFRVCPYYDKKIHNKLVRRLIAEHFIPNPLNRPQVNHIDGDKQNNAITNLEWVTNQQNRIHAYKTGLQSGRPGLTHHNTKLTESQIYSIRHLYDVGEDHQKIADEFGVHKATVSKIGLRNRWKHLEER